MSSLREIKGRITAAEKTVQITKAMNMVSASKLKKAERSISSYRPLLDKIAYIVSNVLNSNSELSHPLLQPREVKKVGYILISSDRGLAGPYNSSIFKAFQAYVKENHQSNDEFMVGTIGFKAHTFAKKMGYNIINQESINVRDDVLFVDFKEITKQIVRLYETKLVDKVVVFFNHYVNTITQKVETKQILPIDVAKFNDNKTNTNIEYLFEPGKQEVINELIPLYLDHTLYGIILDAKTSEHASRMQSMKSATDNGTEVINKLALHYNRARQQAITTELTDIIGGASAIN